ncbi:hypothetical protein EDF56_10380 [Novosphingobium sp. PhB165]|uniref:hypothetical protein n=1 Tax=Novosphingobium sp. PhB165 TaxID=2485105 RepID=UPI001047B763|nr:hypothetical protein [Novosphingobium sp. PhB165]TCM19444.1 hypothetical protein EDF56_10380 [Novosphingobium sp. PhB165]
MNKIAAGLVLTMLGASPALAASPLESCRAIGDAAQRLACYDAIPIKGQKAAAPADPVASFGLTETQKQKVAREQPDVPAPVEDVTSKIAVLSATQVTFDNGMVWKVTDGSDILTWARIGQEATVKRGTLGGYRLTIQKVNRLAVVTRVQ